MEHSYHHGHRHRHSRREGIVETLGTPSRTTLMERSRVLVARSTCTNDTDAGCQKPTSIPTLPIVFAVVIPIFMAACVLFYLHRRHLRKLKEEDAQDKYKSLDFGMDSAQGAKKKKGGPEMALADTENSIRGGGHGRGVSLDLDVNSPYILPAGLHSSRESFHSLSRSTNDPHDPYRPVTFIRDDASVRSGSRAGSHAYRHDNGSMYTTSSGGTERNRMNDGLLRNAQRMSQSAPPRGDSISPQDKTIPEIKFPEPAASALSPLNPRSYNDPLPPPPPPPVPSQHKTGQAPEPQTAQDAYVPFKPTPPAAAASPAPMLPPVQETKAPVHTNPSPPPRIQSQQADVQTNPNTTSFMSESSYGDGFQVTPPSPPPAQQPKIAQPAPLAPQPRRPHNEGSALAVDEFGQNTNRLSMSLRPLPPDDPNDNPEQRANRIRSFYKEYFDDSKPEPVGNNLYNDYYEDYGSEYLDGTIFDPETGAFVVAQPAAPFAQPVTRRAMTPPPRAPPRFRSNTGPRGPHMSGSSMASSGRFMPPPRGMSSMSGRLPAPRKPLPPPTPLASLPTPAKLTENSMVFDPIDFAPPVSFRERQNGMRPDSPLGNARPYSPAVRPHTPLASAFDDLMVMPSPHALRRSGTFTALDFAPPPRFRDPGSNASDAGSIRSNRSGMSAAGRMAVRNGAYRVSKIPKEVVGTRDDLMVSLKPQLNMVAPA